MLLNLNSVPYAVIFLYGHKKKNGKPSPLNSLVHSDFRSACERERSTLTAAATPGNRGRKWQTTEDIPISEDFSLEDNIFLRQLSSQSLLLFFLFSFYFMDLPQRKMTYWKMIQDLKNPNNLNLCSSRYCYGSLFLILRKGFCFLGCIC